MKRAILLQKNSEKEEVNIERIQEGDSLFIEKSILMLKDELRKTNNSIEDFLKNPKLTISEEFINLVKEKENIEQKISLYNKVKENYI